MTANNHPNRASKTAELRNQMRKADVLMAAARTLAGQYRDEGNRHLADAVETSLGGLPVESLSRLHDILQHGRYCTVCGHPLANDGKCPSAMHPFYSKTADA